MGDIVLAGATSGTITLTPTATAGSSTITLPAANGTIITTASSGQSIPKAALPTGSVLQVVEGTFSGQTSSSTSTLADTGLSVSITPNFSTSRIAIFFTSPVLTQSGTEMGVQIIRNTTSLTADYKSGGATGNSFCSCTGIYYDNPSTTSSTTYKLQFRRIAGSGIVYFGTLEGPAVSRILVMEIAA